MTCSICNRNDSLVWAHNGGCDMHHWDDKTEGYCSCSPKMICAACDAPLLVQFGFVVLDAQCFGYSNDTLQ